MAERVVDDLEIVKVDEEHRGDLLAAGRLVRPKGALEGQLEHAPIGGTRERVAFGEVLHMPQQDGIAQVERGRRRELPQYRCDPALDPEGVSRTVLDDDG